MPATSQDTTPRPTPPRGFTLIELLVVVAIIGLLIALLLPATRSSRSAARRSQCVNNLKHIGLGLYNYESSFNVLPPALAFDAEGRAIHSWRTLVLPFVESSLLYNEINLSQPWNRPANSTAMQTQFLAGQCPATRALPNTTTYLASVGPDACLHPARPRPLAEITDGHASTLMVIEAGDKSAVPWMAPSDANETLVLGLTSNKRLPHTGGMNALFVDGSIHFLKATIERRTLRSLITIAGRDDPSADEY